MSTKHIIVVGNPVDGLRFYGPFSDAESACSYADLELSDGSLEWFEWWVAPIAEVKAKTL